MAVRSRAVVSDIYEDMQPLVNQIARRFARAHGTDLDETIGNANLIFLDALRDFDRTRSTLEQRLQVFIYSRLLDIQRPVYRWRNKMGSLYSLSFDDTTPEPVGTVGVHVFDRAGLFDTVTDDARTVLGLLLDTPAELLSTIRAGAETGPHAIRRNLRSYLTNSLGWAVERVRETFGEIRSVLEDV